MVLMGPWSNWVTYFRIGDDVHLPRKWIMPFYLMHSSVFSEVYGIISREYNVFVPDPKNKCSWETFTFQKIKRLWFIHTIIFFYLNDTHFFCFQKLYSIFIEKHVFLLDFFLTKLQSGLLNGFLIHFLTNIVQT